MTDSELFIEVLKALKQYTLALRIFHDPDRTKAVDKADEKALELLKIAYDRRLI
jgi:bacterioferritin (cytochrome b1)